MQTESTPEQTSTEALREIVQSFLDKHPRLTVQALAQRSQVPVTSLRRLLQVGQKSEVAPHTVLNLCAYIMREKRIGKLLEVLPPVLSESLKKHFGTFVFEGAAERAFSVDLNNALRDRMSYFIYKLAANQNGTSFLEVTELFGSVGKKKADDMLAQGLLVESGNRLAAKDKDFSLDINVAASHLPELVGFYRPDQVGLGKNLMYSLSESVNDEAIQKIKDIQRDAVKATHAVMRDPQYAGNIPYFTLNLCESFLTEAEGVIQ